MAYIFARIRQTKHYFTNLDAHAESNWESEHNDYHTDERKQKAAAPGVTSTGLVVYFTCCE